MRLQKRDQAVGITIPHNGFHIHKADFTAEQEKVCFSPDHLVPIVLGVNALNGCPYSRVYFGDGAFFRTGSIRRRSSGCFARGGSRLLRSAEFL